MIAPKTTRKKHILYLPNPHRQPLFSDYVTASDGLLVQVVSHLELLDVLNLSVTSKQLKEALAIDGLYCANTKNKSDDEGILLPALKQVAHRLLPLGAGTKRPCEVSQQFAFESITFHKSSEKNGGSSFEPSKILSMNLPDHINALTCDRVRWEQPLIEFAGQGRSAPTQTAAWRSGIRLSYVTNEANNCALTIVWGGKGANTSLTLSVRQQYKQERYLPPNTKHVIDAAIHSKSNLCAILAKPIHDESLSHYILSLVTLPTAPPNFSRKRKDKLDQFTLIWQRHISWDLFSSSETHPIVSFSPQGKYIIFGSTERFGIIGIENESRIFEPMTSKRSTINTYLLYQEFLFVLENGGKRIRVYDLTNTNNSEPLAEAEIPWSVVLSTNHKKASGLVRLHHSHEQHQHQLRNEFQLVFCGGRIWITGFFNFDLICSSPRLLRRLRSHISSDCKYVPLQFFCVKNDFQLSAPKPMHVWNDTHLYIVDSTKIYCWKVSKKAATHGGIQLSTILSGNDYIESIYCDGTKLIVATNCTFRNTSVREWDGSGSITIIPFDAYEPLIHQTQFTSSTAKFNRDRDRRNSTPLLELTNPKPYTPLLQLYNKRFFRHHTFTGRINAPNGHGSNLSTLRHPISSSTESNYRIVDMFSEDGRYLVLCCKKGLANKVVVFDLYSSCNGFHLY